VQIVKKTAAARFSKRSRTRNARIHLELLVRRSRLTFATPRIAVTEVARAEGVENQGVPGQAHAEDQ
jgi:hypothetical protein